MDASTWPVLFELSVPFDTKTIYGWYLLLMLLISLDLAYLVCIVFGTTQFIGSCIYIVAICDQFDSNIQMIQTNIEQNQRETNREKNIKTKIQINKQIHDAIQIHARIYE